jgi:hypothetical protein
MVHWSHACTAAAAHCHCCSSIAADVSSICSFSLLRHPSIAAFQLLDLLFKVLHIKHEVREQV